MKNILYFLLFVCFTSKALAVDFLPISLEEALEKASKENKKVLAYFTAKWCGPCRVMEKNVFSNDTVQQKLNVEFIAIKVDVDTYYGEKLSKKYQVTNMPTFIMLDANKKILNRHCGYLATPAFVNFLSCINVNTALEEFEQERLAKKERFIPEIGVRIGVNRTNISNLYDIPSSQDISPKIAINTDVFLSLMKDGGNWLLRQSVGFASKGNQNIRLQYLHFPFEIGYTFYKPTFFGLSGGVRIVASPYYALLLNKDKTNLNKQDYGFRYGISAHTRGASQLELMFYIENGMADVMENFAGKQQNRGLNISAILTL